MLNETSICIDACYGCRIIDGTAARVDAPEVINRVVGASCEGRAEGDGAALVVIGDGIDGDCGGFGVGCGGRHEVADRSTGRIRSLPTSDNSASKAVTSALFDGVQSYCSAMSALSSATK